MDRNHSLINPISRWKGRNWRSILVDPTGTVNPFVGAANGVIGSWLSRKQKPRKDRFRGCGKSAQPIGSLQSMPYGGRDPEFLLQEVGETETASVNLPVVVAAVR